MVETRSRFADALEEEGVDYRAMYAEGVRSGEITRFDCATCWHWAVLGYPAGPFGGKAPECEVETADSPFREHAKRVADLYEMSEDDLDALVSDLVVAQEGAYWDGINHAADIVRLDDVLYPEETNDPESQMRLKIRGEIMADIMGVGAK